MAEVRRLTAEGVDSFNKYLSAQRASATTVSLPEILAEEQLTEKLDDSRVDVENISFENRLEMARYLCERLQPLNASGTDTDPGVWAWLTLFYFDVICPPDPDGNRHPGREYLYLPTTDYRYYYRHLLLGPYQVYQRHGDAAQLLLSGKVTTPGDVYERLASRQEFVASSGIIAAADRLYRSPAELTPKRGATVAGRPGTVRRFVVILQQLDRTYDLQSMTGEEILSLLPDEFSRWFD